MGLSRVLGYFADILHASPPLHPDPTHSPPGAAFRRPALPCMAIRYACRNNLRPAVPEQFLIKSSLSLALSQRNQLHAGLRHNITDTHRETDHMDTNKP